MRKGIFNQLLDNLERAGAEARETRARVSEGRAQPEIPVVGRDKERVCGVFLHAPVDAELSAGYERAAEAEQHGNLVWGDGHTGDNQIRILADGIAPAVLSGVFHENLKTADEAGVIDAYRVLDGGVLPALDGLWHYSSKKIHCEHCLRITRAGETTYYHSALAEAIVKPGSNAALPVMGR